MVGLLAWLPGAFPGIWTLGLSSFLPLGPLRLSLFLQSFFPECIAGYKSKCSVYSELLTSKGGQSNCTWVGRGNPRTLASGQKSKGGHATSDAGSFTQCGRKRHPRALRESVRRPCQGPQTPTRHNTDGEAAGGLEALPGKHPASPAGAAAGTLLGATPGVGGGLGLPVVSYLEAGVSLT